MAYQLRGFVRMINAKTQVVQDVPEAQGHGLADKGWFKVADAVGPTSARPNTGLFGGYRYFDTTLSKIVIWVGGGGGMQHGTNGAEPGFWTDGTAAV